MLRWAAEPIGFLRVTAPVAAWVRFSPACLIRNPEMTRWTICKTGVRSSGCAANRKRSGIGNDNTLGQHWHPGDDVIDQVGGRLRHAPGTTGGTIPLIGLYFPLGSLFLVQMIQTTFSRKFFNLAPNL